jgi:hypothetical protein
MSCNSSVIYATFSAHFSPTAEPDHHRAADLRAVLELCARLAATAMRHQGRGGWGPDDADFVAVAVVDKVGRVVAKHRGLGFLDAPEAALTYLQTAVVNLVRDDRRRHRSVRRRVRCAPELLTWVGSAHERRIVRMGGDGGAGTLLCSGAQVAQLEARAVSWLFGEALPALAAARPGIADRLRVLEAYADARRFGGDAWEERFEHRFGAPWSGALRAQMGRGRSDLVESLDRQLRGLAAELWLDAADVADPEAIIAAYAALEAAGPSGLCDARAAASLRFCRTAVARLWVGEHLRERAASVGGGAGAARGQRRPLTDGVSGSAPAPTGRRPRSTPRT